MRAIAVFLVAAAVGLVVFVVVQFSSVDKDGIKVGVKQASACTEAAPDCLPKITLRDTEQRVWTPDELAGKVVVVNFWATWCEPCKTEVPDLAAVYRRHRDDGLVLFGLLRDSASDVVLDNFVKSHGLNYPVVRVDDELLRAFETPTALPTTFIYDRGGHLHTMETGSLTERQLESMVSRLLAAR